MLCQVFVSQHRAPHHCFLRHELRTAPATCLLQPSVSVVAPPRLAVEPPYPSLLQSMYSLSVVVVSNVFTQSPGVRRGTAFDMAVEPPSPLP